MTVIDLHTHILPDWDDGAKDWAEAGRMMETAWEDGIRVVVLTPHIFRMNNYGDDLNVLTDRMRRFGEMAGKTEMEYLFGAEIYVHHEMIRKIEANPLTINCSQYLFIEFPKDHILPGVRDLIFGIMNRGYVPIISHPERNSVFIRHPGMLCDLVKGGCLAQVTAMSLTGGFGRTVRRAAELFVKKNLVQIIASDAHDAKNRPPALGKGIEAAARLVGEEKALAMATAVPQAVIGNQAPPDLGEPENPDKKMMPPLRFPKFWT